MENQISKLKNKVFSKKSKETFLTPIIKLIRELGCFSSIIGSKYEVYDNNGDLVYTIKQKPITFQQIYELNKELNNLEEAEVKSQKKPKIPTKKGRK